jgi:hypothetical protein
MINDFVRRPTFVVRLTPEPGVEDSIRLLRQVLKLALRRFGLRCTRVYEEKNVLDRDAEFRQALAKALKAARDVALTPSISKEMKVHELGDREWNWIITAAIFAWNNAQRDSLKSGYDQLGDILPNLGALPLDWNRPLKEWSKDERLHQQGHRAAPRKFHSALHQSRRTYDSGYSILRRDSFLRITMMEQQKLQF